MILSSNFHSSVTPTVLLGVKSSLNTNGLKNSANSTSTHGDYRNSDGFGLPSWIIHRYFKFYSYFGLCPFKTKFDYGLQRYRIVKNWRQRVSAAIVGIVTVIEFVYSLRSAFKTKGKQQTYFKLSELYGCFFLRCCFMYTMWKKSTAFEDLLNILNETMSTFTSGKTMGRNSKAKILALIFFGATPIIVSISELLVEIERYDEKYYWDTERFYELRRNQTKDFSEYIFFTETHPSGFFVAIYIILFVYTRMNFVACKILLLSSAVSMLKVLEATEDHLTRCSGLEGFRVYSKLKAVSRANKKATSMVVFGFVIGSIAQVMFSIPILIQPPGFFSFMKNITEFGITFGFLVIAAIIKKQAAEMFGDWLEVGKKFLELDERSLEMFLFELSREEIGFSAAGFINLTTSFLGGAISVGLTLSVVIIGPDFNK